MTASSGKMTDEIKALKLRLKRMSKISLAYAAGFVDADGCITATVSKRGPLPMPILLATNSNAEIIRWFQKMFGVGCSHVTKPGQNNGRSNAKWKNVHCFRVTTHRAQLIAEALTPYLRVKKEQALLVASLPAKGRDFKYKCPESLLVEASVKIVKLRALNRRGIVVA